MTVFDRMDVVEHHISIAQLDRRILSPEIIQKHLSAVRYISDRIGDDQQRCDFESYCRACSSAGLPYYGRPEDVFSDQVDDSK